MPSSRGSSQLRDRVEPMSLMFPSLPGRFFTTVTTWEAQDRDESTGSSLRSVLGIDIYGSKGSQLKEERSWAVVKSQSRSQFTP